MTDEEQIAECPECGDVFAAPAGAVGIHSAKGQANRHLKAAHGIEPAPRLSHKRVGPGRPKGSKNKPKSEAPTVTEIFQPPAEEPKTGFLKSWLTGPRRKTPAAPGEVRPKRPKSERRQPSRRKSLAKGIGLAWGQGLSPLAYASGNYPVGRVLEFQAGAAGLAFDDLLAGTWVDKLIQPIASEADKWGAAGSIVALPLTMLAYSQSFDPSTGRGNPMIEQMLRWVLKPNMEAMADAVQRMETEALEFGATIEKLEKVGIVTPGDPDPMGSFIAMLMAPPVPRDPSAAAEPAPAPDMAEAVTL